MSFSANPEPKDEEAVWHVAKSLESGADRLDLNSGSALKGKYEALSLVRTGDHHLVEAVLVINDPVQEDAENVYYLRVQNDLGNNDYHVRIVVGDEPPAEVTTLANTLPPVQVLFSRQQSL